MQLCTQRHLTKLIELGRLIVSNVPDPTQIFLDDFRVGFRLRETLWKLDGQVNLSNIENSPVTEMNLANAVLFPNTLYLAISQEEFSLPNNLIGFINTRSTYARIGLEMVRASTIITPGFGSGSPTPIVFEIMTLTKITGLNPDKRYAFACFFELQQPIESIPFDYWTLFPLNYLKH